MVNKEFARIQSKGERAVLDRSFVPLNEMSDRQIWQTKYLIYCKAVNEINTRIENFHIRMQIDATNKPDEKAEIIQRYILRNYTSQWSNLGRQINIKDITLFDSNDDYLTQFDIQ